MFVDAQQADQTCNILRAIIHANQRRSRSLADFIVGVIQQLMNASDQTRLAIIQRQYIKNRSHHICVFVVQRPQQQRIGLLKVAA